MSRDICNFAILKVTLQIYQSQSQKIQQTTGTTQPDS